MLKINRKVEYGLVAVRHMLSKPREELTSVREICDAYGTPFDPVAHVLRLLNREGIVQSEQGAHGGYRLAGDVSQTSLAEFIKVIDGQIAFADCFRNDKRSSCNLKDSCNINQPMDSLNRQMVGLLKTLTLDDFFSGSGLKMLDSEGV